jgi:hypothetical protein
MKCSKCNGSGLWHDRFAAAMEKCPSCLGAGTREGAEKIHKEMELQSQEDQCDLINREPHYCWQKYPEAAARLGIPKPKDVRNGRFLCACCNVPWKYCENR